MTDFKEEIKGLDAKINSLEKMQKKETSNKEKEFDELRNAINSLKQRIDSKQNVKSVTNIWMIMGIICCVLLSIIAITIYNNYNDIILLQQAINDHHDDCNILYDIDINQTDQTMRVQINELVKTIDQINGTIIHWNDQIKSYIDSVLVLETKIYSLTSNTTHIPPSIDMNKKKKQSHIITWWIKPTLYYGFKLIVQTINLWCMAAVCYPGGGPEILFFVGNIASYMVIKIFYFYPTDYIDSIMMFMFIILSCGGSWIVYKYMDHQYVHCTAFLAELSVLYWRFWCNDDEILVVATFMICLYCFVTLLLTGSGGLDIIHCIAFAVIEIYIIFFFD